MATRSFKRDARGRFAVTDSRGSSKKKKLTPLEREAMKAADKLNHEQNRLREDALVASVNAAEELLKKANRAAKRARTDGEHEGADEDRVKALKALVKAKQRLAKFDKQRSD